MLSAYLKPMGETVAKRWFFAKTKNSQKIISQPVLWLLTWKNYFAYKKEKNF